MLSYFLLHLQCCLHRVFRRRCVALQGLLDSDPALGPCFRRCAFLVLDEADRLLEPSFEAELEAVLSLLPEARQTLLFSATMTKALVALQKVGLPACLRLLGFLRLPPVCFVRAGALSRDLGGAALVPDEGRGLLEGGGGPGRAWPWQLGEKGNAECQTNGWVGDGAVEGSMVWLKVPPCFSCGQSTALPAGIGDSYRKFWEG